MAKASTLAPVHHQLQAIQAKTSAPPLPSKDASDADEAKHDDAILQPTVRLVPKTYALRRSKNMTFNEADEPIAISTTHPSANGSAGFSKVCGMKVPREQAILEMMEKQDKNDSKVRLWSARKFGLRR